MELHKDNKDSWLFCIWEGLEGLKYKAKYGDKAEQLQWEEIETAMKWIIDVVLPLQSFTEEKIELIQKKGLLQQLYILTMSGSAQLSSEERGHISDMILRRKEKE